MAYQSTYGRYNQFIGPSRKKVPWKYDGWSRGKNNFSEDNEIRPDEYYQGKNIEMTGRSSIRLGRRGHRLFTSVSGVSKHNGSFVYKNPITSTNLLLSMHDGRLRRITTSGTVTEIDATKTWDATAKTRGVLLRGSVYFGNAIDFLSKSDGTTVTRWSSETAASGLALTATGTGPKSYVYGVTVVTETGETEGTTSSEVFNANALTASNKNTFSWNRKTSTQTRGYNVWRSENGGTFVFLNYIENPSSGATVTYVDDGTDQAAVTSEMPTFNTTGGVKGSIYDKYANTLFIAGNLQEPDTVFYGGSGAQFESFSPDANGGWIKPGRGDGESVTAMIGFEDFLFIFKNNSIWKFTFASDGSPSLSSVIPQYGTSSPETVRRMEKDVVYLGSDGRIRILGYEPTQINVIRTTDLSNRVQPDIDLWSTTNLEKFHAEYFEQKYILCNIDQAIPYDRRYIGFHGVWTNFTFNQFLLWDKGTKKQLIFGFEDTSGKIHQVLTDNTWDDNGTVIPVEFTPRRIDGGDDTILKWYDFARIKLKEPRGALSIDTYRDGNALPTTIPINFSTGGGIDSFMFDDFMFDEASGIETNSAALQVIKLEEYFEAYSLLHTITINANEENHAILQTMNGVLEIEDFDYDRDENIERLNPN